MCSFSFPTELSVLTGCEREGGRALHTYAGLLSDEERPAAETESSLASQHAPALWLRPAYCVAPLRWEQARGWPGRGRQLELGGRLCSHSLGPTAQRWPSAEPALKQAWGRGGERWDGHPCTGGVVESGFPEPPSEKPSFPLVLFLLWASATVAIPKETYRFVIGKNGKKLQDLELKTATKDPDPRPDDASNQIRITGTKENVRRHATRCCLSLRAGESNLCVRCVCIVVCV